MFNKKFNIVNNLRKATILEKINILKNLGAPFYQSLPQTTEIQILKNEFITVIIHLQQVLPLGLTLLGK